MVYYRCYFCHIMDSKVGDVNSHKRNYLSNESIDDSTIIVMEPNQSYIPIGYQDNPPASTKQTEETELIRTRAMKSEPPRPPPPYSTKFKTRIGQPGEEIRDTGYNFHEYEIIPEHPWPTPEPRAQPVVVEPTTIPEPQPVVAQTIPEPQPVVAQTIPEPQSVVVEPTTIPEPQSVVVEPTMTPEPQPVVAQTIPEPQPVVVEPTMTPEPQSVVAQPTSSSQITVSNISTSIPSYALILGIVTIIIFSTVLFWLPGLFCLLPAIGLATAVSVFC